MTFLSGISNLTASADGAHDGGRATASASVSPSASGNSPDFGLTIGLPVLGVTATFSAESLQALAGAAADAVTGAADDLAGAGADVVKGATRAATRVMNAVGDGAGAVLDAAGEAGSQVASAAGNVIGYGVMAALAGGAVLDELV
ncbi:hypothetical protein CDN99_13270 [Roseateles aquatilis]|uniref:Uncharacterized protein n=1 Tax=Roseateles aquatilis TaxID=431061 RepID=A0A246JCD7_9BURK|nr:hypothetical protein [Roseateles aquatilis]OWQ90332.1 hypothetical protein CDN99_13270 [Roseateles aquatilis]